MKGFIFTSIIIIISSFTVIATAKSNSTDIWLWGYKIGQPYSEVESQLKAFDRAGDSFTSEDAVHPWKWFERAGTWKLSDKERPYSLTVCIYHDRIVRIALIFEGHFTESDLNDIENYFVASFVDQGISREDMKQANIGPDSTYGFSDDRLIIDIWKDFGGEYTGHCGISIESTEHWSRAEEPKAVAPVTPKPVKPQPEKPQGITPKKASSLALKSKARFKKEFSGVLKVVEAYKTNRIEYAKFEKYSIYREVTLDERFAVLKYSRTRRAYGTWLWRFVRASELEYGAQDRIIGVQVYEVEERPVKCRKLDDHFYWRNGYGDYEDPSLYVEWWTYISFSCFSYPFGATLYFSMRHPGILDENHYTYEPGFYQFTDDSILDACIISSVDL